MCEDVLCVVGTFLGSVLKAKKNDRLPVSFPNHHIMRALTGMSAKVPTTTFSNLYLIPFVKSDVNALAMGNVMPLHCATMGSDLTGDGARIVAMLVPLVGYSLLSCVVVVSLIECI